MRQFIKFTQFPWINARYANTKTYLLTAEIQQHFSPFREIQSVQALIELLLHEDYTQYQERKKHLICGQLKIEKTSKGEKRLHFFSPQRCRHYRHGLIHPMGWKGRCMLDHNSSGAIQLFCQEFTWHYSSFNQCKNLNNMFAYASDNCSNACDKHWFHNIISYMPQGWWWIQLYFLSLPSFDQSKPL